MNNVLCVVPNNLKIDIAVIKQCYTQINILDISDHIVELDTIVIDESVFKLIFYNTDTFSINPVACSDLCLNKYISFFNKTVNDVSFCLLDTIYNYIENDLNINRQMFSLCSLIALNKEISAIKSLCNLGKPTCSLSWSQIKNTIATQFTLNPNTLTQSFPVTLTISVVFLTPTPGVHPVIVKFNYNTTVTIP